MVATQSPQNQKVARRLLAADGYLDLSMPSHALKELEKIEDPGSFEPSVFYLRGLALKQMGQVESAIPWLEEAARLIPAPLNRFAWKSLGDCYTLQGNQTMAELMRVLVEADEDVDVDSALEELRHSLAEPPNIRPKRKNQNQDDL